MLHKNPAPNDIAEIVDRCLALIKPRADKEADCRLVVTFSIRSASTHPYPKFIYEDVETKKRKQSRRSLAKALRKASIMLSTAEVWGQTVDEMRETLLLCEKLNTIAERAEQMATCRVPKGARPIDRAKLAAASNALRLINDFADAQPTLTADGPFYELASILHESATGNVRDDLSWYCRKVFHAMN